MIQFRSYTSEPFFTADYEKVRLFLTSINRGALYSPNFTWGRWEWMTTHAMLDISNLSKIGLWEENGEIVAMAAYETTLGNAYPVIGPNYEFLIPEVVAHAVQNLQNHKKLMLLIGNNNRPLQQYASAKGFRPTQEQEHVAVLEPACPLTYALPDGFHITSMDQGWNYYKYDTCMWRGFNHPGYPKQDDYQVYEVRKRRQMLSSPMIKPELMIAIEAPGGRYAAHCGLWYQEGDDYALVEPVATDPDYRMMGLGKAAVYEAANRCMKMGAKTILVGSSQQFYYNIGFCPCHTETWWALK